MRAAIGLIAAYAIALQALFAAALPVHAADVDFAQVLCLGSGNGAVPAEDPSAPAPLSGQTNCFHCVLCAASAASAILPEPGARPAIPFASAFLAPAIPGSAPALFAARSGPSRAPPPNV